MAHHTIEISPYSGRPVRLFRFTHGSAASTYTSAEVDITYNEEVYVAIQIGHSNIGYSDGELTDLTVDVPRDNPVAQLFQVAPPSQSVELTLLDLHRGDDEARVLWIGSLRPPNWNGEGKAIFTCKPLSEVYEQEGPPDMFQATCGKALYSARCGVDPENFKSVITVDSVSGAVVTASGLVSLANLQRGKAVRTLSGARIPRMIVAHDSDTIELFLAFESLQVGETLDIYPGCNRTMAVCDEDFSNLDNFPGFPFMPDSDPFQNGGML
jgi:uncharacterized phage protein (TIGR02218 family)